MSRQLSTIIIVVLSLIAAAAIYFYVFENNAKKVMSSSAIPDNAALVIEFKDPQEQIEKLNNLEWFKLFTEQPSLANAKNELQFLDSLFLLNQDFNQSLKNGEFSISIHPFANKSFGMFMSVQLQNDVNINHVVNFLNSGFSRRFVFTKRTFTNEIIYDFTDFTSKEKFTICFKKGLLLFSFDGSLCELALLKLKRNEIQQQTNPLDFVYQSNTGINIYINPKVVPLFINAFIPFGSEAQLPFINRLCKNIALNVNVNNSEISFKGAALTHDTLFQYLDLLNAQAPVENIFDNLIPENFNYAYQLNISDYKGFYTNLKEYLNSRGIYSNYAAYIDSIEQHLQISFTQNLGKYMGNGAALLSINEPGINYDSANIVLVKVNDANGVDRLLKSYQNAIEKKYKYDTTNIISKNETIEECNLGYAFKIFWGDAFANIEFKNYFIYNGFLIYSNNKAVLESYNAYLTDKKLAINNKDFKNVKSNLVKQSNIEFIVNGKNAYKHALYFINKEWHSYFSQNANYFNRIGYAAVQIAGSLDRTFITNGFVSINTNVLDANKELWQIQLDTLITGKPQIVFNSERNQQVILVQDKNYKLNFITTDGEVFNKIDIDDEIISDIEVVDIYKNGKTFYLFNTQKFIYLITEDGKPAFGWPAWIPTGTLYPLSYTEIDGNLMVFVTGNLYKVSAFNNRGQLYSGFNPKNVWPNIVSSIGSFVYGNQPYFYGLNQTGNVTVFNQDGRDFNLLNIDSGVVFNKVKIKNIDTGTVVIYGIDSTSFIQTEQSTYKFKKDVSTTAVGMFNEFLLTKSAKLEDLFVLSAPHRLVVLSENKQVLINKLFSDSSLQYVSVKTLSNSLNIVYKHNNYLYFEDLKGKITKPFPVPCTTKYQIKGSMDGDNYLVFGYNNNLKLYKIR